MTLSVKFIRLFIPNFLANIFQHMSKPPLVRIKPVFSLISTLLKPDNHKIEIVYNLRRHFLRSIDLSNFWYLAYIFNPLVVIYHLYVIFCQVTDYEFQRMHFLKKKFGEFFLAAMYYTKNPYPICYSELHYKYVVCRKKTPIIVITTSCMT